MSDFKLNETKAGRFLTISSDIYIGRSIEAYGEWSYGEIEALRGLIRQQDNVIEVGANIGAHSVFIARDLCSQGTLYAFEPRRILFQLLCANLMLNGVTNAETLQFALGKAESRIEEGQLPVTAPVNAGAFALGKIPGAGEEIRIMPLDALINRLKPIALLKADVEGHEVDVLTGAGKLIARDRPFLYLENDRPELSEALIRHVLGLDYDLYWHIVPLYRVHNHAGNAANIFGNTASFNMLGFPAEKRVNVTGLAKITDPSAHPLGSSREG